MGEIKINATKILVEDIPEIEKQTEGGIIIPTAVVKNKTSKGVVIAVGSGTNFLPIPYKEGDTVIFPPTAGVKFKHEDKEYRLVDVSEIFMSL